MQHPNQNDIGIDLRWQEANGEVKKRAHQVPYFIIMR